MRLRSYLALSALFLALPTINTKNSVAAISQVSPSQAQITILYDAFGQNSRMQKDWGYAALVEYGGKRILFDTGNNPRILAENAKAKGIDLTKLRIELSLKRESQSDDLCSEGELRRVWRRFAQ